MNTLVKKITILPMILLGFLFINSAVYADHFSSPEIISPNFMKIIGYLKINGLDAEPGDEVAVLDSNQIILEHTVVTANGEYVLTLFGDDLNTEIDEGFQASETISFLVWDKSEQSEIVVEDSMLTPVDREYPGLEVHSFDPQCFTFPGMGTFCFYQFSADASFHGLDIGVTYTPPEMTIIDFSPKSSDISGGGTLSITGTNFKEGITVTFGDTNSGQVSVINSSFLACTVPAHGYGIVPLIAVNPDGKAFTVTDAFEFIAPSPEILSVHPNKGHIDGNIPITILGKNFQQGLVVKLADNDITEYTFSENQITFINPSNTANIVDITVTNPDAKNTMFEGAFEYKDIIAKFDILSQNTGKAPFTVVLEDSSIGDVEEWFW
ncbi:secreted protein containing Cell surface receptor IPT/TIG domain protein, partial [Candidatus Magnetomorum sp. HK-1]